MEPEIEKSIEKTQKIIKKNLTSKKRAGFQDYALEKIRQEVREILNLPEIALELPPAHIRADLSLPVFDLAKATKEDPVELARKIAKTINNICLEARLSSGRLIEKAETAGPFVNLFLEKTKTYDLVILQIIKLNQKYGESAVNAGKTALIDYSGPNIAKPIGVGHLRSTIIGQALANIYEKTGYAVIKDNHLGDWGTQFGKLVYAYQEWGDKKKIAENPIKELNNLYIKFHEEAKKNSEIENKAREIFRKMEEGDKKLINLWTKFKKISLAEFKKIYERLGVKFDTYIGESHFAKETDKMVEECLEKKIARIDEATGAVVVEALDGLPSFLLRKKDDSGLYLTRDLAALIFRVEVFEPDEILYVVGEEQSLHFKQLFALAKALGYINGAKAKHIGFGLVLAGGKKMSTRKGTLVELEQLMSQSVAKSREILLQKNKGLSAKELNEISEIVGIGAIIYNDLRQSRQKNISFDWDRMLDFEGGSAVYLQYTVARINSILKKMSPMSRFNLDIGFEKESEFNLAKKLMFYPQIILEAQGRAAPHLIATYLEELAQLFNAFYNDVSIIGTKDEKLRLSRMALIKAVATTTKNGLGLLNIKIPDRI